jgi:hypothetical protein
MQSGVFVFALLLLHNYIYLFGVQVLSRETDAVILGSSIIAALAGISFFLVSFHFIFILFYLFYFIYSFFLPPFLLIHSHYITNHYEGGTYKTVVEAMSKMCAAGRIVEPAKDELIQKYHTTKHDIFLKMYSHEVEFRNAMSQF